MDDAMEDPMNSRSMSSMGDSSQDDVSDNAAPADERKRSLSHRPRGFATLTPAAAKAASQRSLQASASPLGPPDFSAVQKAKMAEGAAPLPAQDLEPFADQLVAMAEQLRSGAWHSRAPANEQSSPSRTAAPIHSPEIGKNNPRKTFAEMARLSYAKRRKRASVFGDTELFGEPAWDILLDLYIAQAEDKPVSVSSACIGSAAPPTTGLRWLGVLAEQGLVEREHDPQDQRRVLVRLTEKALEAMDAYFESSAALQNDRRTARF